MPHRLPGRARPEVQRLRPREDSIQFLPQPALPQVPGDGRAAWLAKRDSELLPVPYFHVVFTLPHELAPSGATEQASRLRPVVPRRFKDLAGSGRRPEASRAQIGCLMVLHTWGQNLMHHPHVHAVVTGGGLSPDGSRWVHGKTSGSRQPFFAPAKILSRVFRGKFIALLKRAFASGKLGFHGRLKPLNEAVAFVELLNQATRHDWVVYAKRPFASPNCVLKYLRTTRTGSPSPISDWSSSARGRSASATRTTRMINKPRSCASRPPSSFAAS